MSEIKEYTNGEITVVWNPSLCTHSARCAAGLPLVFNPKRRPWIDLSQADSDRIATQVRRCPSGALSLKPTEEL